MRHFVTHATLAALRTLWPLIGFYALARFAAYRFLHAKWPNGDLLMEVPLMLAIAMAPLTAGSWYTAWRRTADSIREFWLGLVLMLAAQWAIVFTIVLSVRKLLATAGAPIVSLHFEPALLLFGTLLFTIQLSLCVEIRPMAMNVHRVRQRFLALGVFYFALFIALVIATYSPLLGWSVAEVMAIATFCFSNALARNSLRPEIRRRVFYAGAITVAVVTTAIILWR